jgi:hypothetical protein
VACLGCLVAGSAARADDAQPAASRKPAGLTTLEIYNGPVRTVHFFSSGTSRSDRGILRDLERAENEISLTDQLLALRQMYASDERNLQRQRRAILERLAMVGTGFAPGVYPDETFAVDLNNTRAFADSYLRVLGAPYFGRGFGGFGFHGDGAFPYLNGLGGAAGIGVAPAIDDGGLRNQLVTALGAEATPEYRAQMVRNLDMAMSRAGQSDTLRAALDLPQKGGVRPAAGDMPPEGRKVVVTLRGGRKVTGTLVRENADTVVLDTPDEEIEIRRSETESIAYPKK